MEARMMAPKVMTAMGGWMMSGMGAVCLLVVLVLLLATAALIKYLCSSAG
jgi:hypothetical protein